MTFLFFSIENFELQLLFEIKIIEKDSDDKMFFTNQNKRFDLMALFFSIRFLFSVKILITYVTLITKKLFFNKQTAYFYYLIAIGIYL